MVYGYRLQDRYALLHIITHAEFKISRDKRLRYRRELYRLREQETTDRREDRVNRQKCGTCKAEMLSLQTNKGKVLYSTEETVTIFITWLLHSHSTLFTQ